MAFFILLIIQKLLFLHPMKQRRLIAWMLVIVSMVMLTASVLPHHHHQHILCLHSDIETCGCECEDSHSHEATHHESCEEHCITNFVTIHPEGTFITVTPDYSICQVLYTLADILSIPLPISCQEDNLSPFYIERYYSACMRHVIGLRAPPCC